MLPDVGVGEPALLVGECGVPWSPRVEVAALVDEEVFEVSDLACPDGVRAHVPFIQSPP